MAANYLSSVPKLLGRENYGDWSFAVENFLVLEGLTKCIDGTEMDPVLVAKAKAKLVLTLDPSIYIHVKEAVNAKEVWEKLRSLYEDSGPSRKIGLLRILINLRLENSESMESYVNQVIEVSQKLRRTGFSINEEWVGSLLLAGLPERYSPLLMAIEHSGIHIGTDSIKAKLMDMAVDGANRDVRDRTAGALLSRGGNFKKNSTEGSSKNRQKTPLSQIVCFRCKQKGHFMSKCPNKNDETNSKPVYKGNYTERPEKALSATFLSGNFNTDDFYIDSGASLHLTARKDWLENIDYSTNVKEITVANKEKIPVICSGEISMKTNVGSEKFNIKVKDVHYVQGLTTNLLSVSQLIKNGNKLSFYENGCDILNDQGMLVARAELINNVYKLNFEKPESALMGVAATDNVWHRRLGHPGYNSLKLMSEGAVEGLKVKGKVGNPICQTCCEGKQSKNAFPKQGHRATEMLEIIHADLCGPMEKYSLGGSRYFLLFEDDFTRMVFVYFLKCKSETIEQFKKFKALVENQTGSKIKTFRSDGGGEFCSLNFEKILSQNGIVHQKTNPYCPQQNGMCERMNRTIIEKGRCLLFDAKLDKQFWAEAVNTAVYLRNRTISKVLDNKTPFEMWYHRKPDVSHIRIFGSEVMVHIPEEKRRKWDKKAKKMLLVGFSENIKGFRLYDPTDNKIITSRDVVINEKCEYDVIILEEQNTDEDLVSVGDVTEDTMVKSESDISDQVEIDDEYVPDEEVNLEPVGDLRRSQRPRKPRSFNDFVTYFGSNIESNNINIEEDVPQTFSEAISREDSHLWMDAMLSEINSFEKNETWELVDLPKEGTVVKCKWVYKIKSDSDNKANYRARLVAKGYTQKKDVDYTETFSPVVRHSTLRLLIGLAVKHDLKITHLDVKTAFLNGYLNETVYMQQPDGFVGKGLESKVYRLRRAVYGLKQASRAWYSRVDKFMLCLGYKKSEHEPCLFIKREDKSLVIVALYVDDFFIFSNNDYETRILKEKLSSKFEIKDLGEAKNCLGVRITRDHKNECVYLDQKDYIEKLLKRFNMSECKSISTPLDCNIDLSKLKSDDTCNANIPYQRAIGSLMYLAVLTRPDILYSISYLSQYNNRYTEQHWQYVKRLFRYLQGTKDYKLKFMKKGCDVEVFCDADWANSTDDRRSYTGYVFLLAGAAISWKSCKQRTVALSSTESEYMALGEAAKEAIYLKNLLAELTDYQNPIVIFNDIQSAQKLSQNPINHGRSKHIDVRHHFIRDCVEQKLLSIKYIPTNEMTADILTKGLPNVKNSYFCQKLGLTNYC